MAAIQLKNIVKKIYGSTTSYSSYKKQGAGEKAEADGEQLIQDDPANLIDDGGRQVLQRDLVDLMM